MSGRSPLVPIAVGAALLLGGCGSDPQPQRALSPVRLTLDGPTDGVAVDDTAIEVHGRVSPQSAEVLVGGEPAGVAGGTFSVVVGLDEGANIIDVTAGAPRRAAAMTAVRVTRRVPVAIPVLTSKTPNEARQALLDLGLEVAFKRGGGLLDDLLPGTLGVCGTDPEAGERVRLGSTVTIETANVC